ncbi:hypothetical protein VTO73DRAFT_13651 [Trametes versicolor]
MPTRYFRARCTIVSPAAWPSNVQTVATSIVMGAPNNDAIVDVIDDTALVRRQRGPAADEEIMSFRTSAAIENPHELTARFLGLPRISGEPCIPASLPGLTRVLPDVPQINGVLVSIGSFA